MNQKARDKRARPQVSILNTAMQVEQSITEFGYNLPCIPQKKFEFVRVSLALCYD